MLVIMSERIVFQGDCEQLFRSHGLTAVEDFFAYAGGRRINKNSQRQVLTFTLDGAGDRGFFLKRFFRAHAKDMFFGWANTGRLCSQARFECDNALTLRRCGFASVIPVCFGEVMHLGFEKKSFLVTEKLPHQCMTDFVKENWPSFGADAKQTLITQLARTLRRLHDRRISLPDLYIHHIFIRKLTDEYEFAFIDLNRMSRNVLDPGAKIKDLGALFFSMISDYFDEQTKRDLLADYAGERSATGGDRLYDRVDRRARVLASRRGDPIRYWSGH